MKLCDRVLKRNRSLYWAKRMHEIVKFAPEYYDADGVCIVDDWTSVFDIGKSFNSKTLTEKEYLSVENNYVECAIKIAKQSNCKYLTVAYMEDYGWKTQNDMRIEYRSRISVDALGAILKGMLREQCYCVLVNLSRKVQIDVGYDYYMHVLTPLERQELQEIVSSCNLFLDPRES